MMVFALCAAYWTRVYGEWEDLLNRFADDCDDILFAPPQWLAVLEEPRTQASEGEAAGQEIVDPEVSVRRAA